MPQSLPQSFQQQPQLPSGIVNQSGTSNQQFKQAFNPRRNSLNNALAGTIPSQFGNVWGQTPQQVQNESQRFNQKLGQLGGKLAPGVTPHLNPNEGYPMQAQPTTLAGHLAGVATVNPLMQQQIQQQTLGRLAQPNSFKHGGKVNKTGYALVHKGEKVLTKKQQQSLKSKALLKKLTSRD
jgi:hypothetical protein